MDSDRRQLTKIHDDDDDADAAAADDVDDDRDAHKHNALAQSRIAVNSFTFIQSSSGTCAVVFVYLFCVRRCVGHAFCTHF